MDNCAPVLPLLPLDIITVILTYSKVKPLLRFKSVSKQWCNLIDSPYFIKKHLHHSTSSNTNARLMISDLYDRNFYSIVHSCEPLDNNITAPSCDHLDNNTITCSCESLYKNYTIGHNREPICEKKNKKNYKQVFGGVYPELAMEWTHDVEVLGSCNGLLCLCTSRENIIFWNPTTRKQWNLPKSSSFGKTKPFDDFVSTKTFYGFGYVSQTDDYKLVKVQHTYRERGEIMTTKVNVYSLRSNSWTRVDVGLLNESLLDVVDVSDEPFILPPGVFVNECLYWVDIYNQIVAFDIRDESFRIVYFTGVKITDGKVCIRALGGCLCVFYYPKDVGMDLWVMNEHGLQKSWTKLLTVDYSNQEFWGEAKSCHVVPIAYSDDGKKILFERILTKDWAFSYDLARHTVEEVEIPDLPKRFGVMTCWQSLVNPSSRGIHGQAKDGGAP